MAPVSVMTPFSALTESGFAHSLANHAICAFPNRYKLSLMRQCRPWSGGQS
jgi:hypothetical protein